MEVNPLALFIIYFMLVLKVEFYERVLSIRYFNLGLWLDCYITLNIVNLVVLNVWYQFYDVFDLK